MVVTFRATVASVSHGRITRSAHEETPMPFIVRRSVAAALSLSLAAGLAACGDDADREVATPSAVCDAAVDLGAAFGSAPEDPAEMPAFAETTLVPVGDAFVEAYGDDGDLGEAATTLSEAFDAMAESGDPSAFEDPEVAEAQALIGAEVHGGCPVEAVDLTAVEYAFNGAPEELSAGRTSFALTNEGVEDHEMVLFRLNDGVDLTLDELLEGGDEAFADVTFTGVAFGGPDTTAYSAVDLEPGTYFLICFLPVGGAEDGPPHFMEGMSHTLTVT
jgi:hypothetical protein